MKRCGVCELEFDPGRQRPGCPHLNLQSGVPPMHSRRPSKPFNAEYDGICHGCWDVIEIGDEIVMWRGHAHHNDEICCNGLKVPENPDPSQPRDRWA